MEHSKKFAWTWTVKEEYLDEYVRMHLDPWPEILEEHRKAGYRNYSIFQNGNQFSIVLSAATLTRQTLYCSERGVWTVECNHIQNGRRLFDFHEEELIRFMPEIFYLK